MSEPFVTLYTSPMCGYCWAAKRLLDSKSVPYDEVDVSGDPSTRLRLEKETGQSTVPMIFAGTDFIGGYTELSEFVRSNGVDGLFGRERETP
jgi:glutaredoxin 3